MNELVTRAGPNRFGRIGAPDDSRYLERKRARQSRRWLTLTALVALIYGAMPVVDQAVFGADRIADATLSRMESTLGGSISADGRRVIRGTVVDRSLPLTFCVRALLGGAAVIVAGMVMNVAGILAGIDLTAAQALSASALSFLFMSLFRVLTWALVILIAGPQLAVSDDWTHVAQTNLSPWTPVASGAVLHTLIGAVDIVTLAGIAVAAMALRKITDGAGMWACIAAASAWAIVTLLLRLSVSAVLHIPFG
jgi:hypothetical protein